MKIDMHCHVRRLLSTAEFHGEYIAAAVKSFGGMVITDHDTYNATATGKT